MGTAYHPETPHPNPLPQGAREVETVAAPVVVETAVPLPAPVPVAAPVPEPIPAAESPGAEAADGEAAQVAEPIAQPIQH